MDVQLNMEYQQELDQEMDSLMAQELLLMETKQLAQELGLELDLPKVLFQALALEWDRLVLFAQELVKLLYLKCPEGQFPFQYIF